MSEIARTWVLSNGLTVKAFDDSVNYYGDFYNMKLTIISTVRVDPRYFADFRKHSHYGEVVKVLGLKTEYRREIIKAGVSGDDLSPAKAAVLDSFEVNALPYMERADFAERLVRKRFAEIEKELKKPAFAGEDDGE
jgi:hypothetical protein